jgi:hypothetical protein
MPMLGGFNLLVWLVILEQADSAYPLWQAPNNQVMYYACCGLGSQFRLLVAA